MTVDEAQVIVTLMLSADGGCYVCAADLINLFISHFPEHEDLAREAYLDEFPGMEGALDDSRLDHEVHFTKTD